MLNIKIDYKTVIAAALVGAVAVWAAKKAIAGVAVNVNPIDEGNVINEGFIGVWQAMTGSNQALGADIYDWFHPDPDRIE